MIVNRGERSHSGHLKFGRNNDTVFNTSLVLVTFTILAGFTAEFHS
jgi:hypothetical protein